MTMIPIRRISRVAVAAASLVLVAPLALPEVASAGVEDAKREVERIVDQLDALETQADILAEDYAEAVDQKNQLDVEVAEAEVRVAAKETELNELRGDLSEVAIRAFTGAGEDVLGPLFSSPDQYGDGLQRDQYSRVALAVGTTTTDDLDELIASLDRDKRDLEDKRAQVEQLTKTIAEKQQQTDELTAQYKAAEADAKKRYADEIEKEEERRAAEAFARLQAELEQQQAAASSGSSSSSSGSAGTSGGGTTSGGGGSSSGSSGGSSSSGGGSTPAPAPSNIPAVSGLAGVAVSAAYGQLGVPYRYATSNPGSSFDCSGLTHFAWGQAGVYLPRNSRAQAASIPRVPAAAAQPGDLIFYYSPISHVGIYVGGGSYIHAPSTGDVVKVSPVRWGKVVAVGRPG
jgi:cell wall-associated NlpC family hydrolase